MSGDTISQIVFPSGRTVLFDSKAYVAWVICSDYSLPVRLKFDNGF
jgi:hypothetical protein